MLLGHFLRCRNRYNSAELLGRASKVNSCALQQLALQRRVCCGRGISGSIGYPGAKEVIQTAATTGPSGLSGAGRSDTSSIEGSLCKGTRLATPTETRESLNTNRGALRRGNTAHHTGDPVCRSYDFEGKGKSNSFLHKLTELEGAGMKRRAPIRPITSTRDQRTNQKSVDERKKMLLFRDVGMNLDKPILSRDVFLILKYFWFGVEFAIDNELERMLRYFNEHALSELKIIQNSKLMRGPAALSRKRVHVTTVSANLDVVPAFPLLKAARMDQFCTFTEGMERRLRDLLKDKPPLSNLVAQGDGLPAGLYLNRSFNEKDNQQLTVFSRSTFRRPAVVIYSQLGQKLGAHADKEWRRLAYSVANPAILPYLAEEVIKPEDGSIATQNGPTDGRRPHRKDTPLNTINRRMTIDVFSLRSMDMYKYQWVHKLYVRRFAWWLLPKSHATTSCSDNTLISGLLISSSTFVGSKLLEPFYCSVGLRNYLLPHVMLVDHEGYIRWLSGGCPDEYEKEIFPTLLKQLDDEYRSAGGQ